MKACLPLILVCLLLTYKYVQAQTLNDAKVIPGQYIVYYNDDAERSSTIERLFFSSTSAVASSESFRVVHELNRAIAVAGISEEQYEALKQDKSVQKIIPVSTRQCCSFVRSKLSDMYFNCYCPCS